MNKVELETQNEKLKAQLHHTRSALTDVRDYGLKASFEGKTMHDGYVIKRCTEGLERGK